MLTVKPKYLCDKHLILEHREMHEVATILQSGDRASLLSQKMLAAKITKGLVVTHKIFERHKELAAEMTARRMKHSSPLPRFEVPISGHYREGLLEEHMKKCFDCRQQTADVNAAEMKDF